MGKFEKMVVLAVLLLSAIVLAVSLNDDGVEVEAIGPLSAAAERIEEQSQDPVPAAPGLAQEDPGYLLFGEVKSVAPEGPAPEPREDLSGLDEPVPDKGSEARILKSTRGLTPSALDDFMVYDVAASDTWNGLAMRFYGDGRYTTILRMANEEGELRGGAKIYVPVFDFGQEARADRRPLAPEEAPPASPGVVAASTPPLIGRVYVVQNGDSLSGLALKAYGNGKLWWPIYDANRDGMRNPDWLQVGMKLVIPDPEEAARASAARDPGKPRVR